MNYREQILRLPLATVRAAVENLLNSASPDLPNTSKLSAAIDLELAIQNGLITINDVITAQTTSVNMGAGATAYVPDQRIESLNQQVSGIYSTINALQGQIDDAYTKLGSVNTGMDSLLRGLDQVKGDSVTRDSQIADRLSRVESLSRPDKLDAGAVDAAITAAVAAGFGSFKRQIEDAGLQQVAADTVSVRVIDRKSAYQIFGMDLLDHKGNPLMIDLYDHPAAPAIDPNFIWTEPVLRHLLVSQGTGENLWFGGAKGAGKTETARQFAARTGRGFTRINFHKYTTADDYLGSTGLQNGNTNFVDGDFLLAYSCPSTVILLDEISNAAPGELAPLNALLEPNTSVTIGSKVRTKAAGVLIIVADNTLTTGDQSGRYAGTQEMNSALADRFARIVKFTNLNENDETDAVVRHTGCDPRLANCIVKTVNIIRSKVDTGEIVDAPSIRQIIALIRSMPLLGLDEAWETCIGNRQPDESALALQAIKTACLNESGINNLI